MEKNDIVDGNYGGDARATNAQRQLIAQTMIQPHTPAT